MKMIIGRMGWKTLRLSTWRSMRRVAAMTSSHMGSTAVRKGPSYCRSSSSPKTTLITFWTSAASTSVALSP